MRLAVDGIEVDVEAGATILDACRAAGRDVPTLCFDERLAPFGACRVCLVAVDGSPSPVTSCTTPAADGMVVDTGDERARRIAGAVVELVLSELPRAPAAHTELAAVARSLASRRPAGLVSSARSVTITTIRTWRSSTSSASHAGAACGSATRSRERSR